MSSQQDICPKKNLSRNPKIGSPFSPPSDHTLSCLWLVAHLSCIGWVQVVSAWALCACPTSICVHWFFGVHAFAIAYRFAWLCCMLWCLFNSWHWWVLRSSFFASHFFFGLSIAWVWAFSSLIWPSLLSSLICVLVGAPATPLHCSCYDIIYPLFTLLLLGLWAEVPAMPISYTIHSFSFYYLAFLMGQFIQHLRLPWLIFIP